LTLLVWGGHVSLPCFADAPSEAAGAMEWAAASDVAPAHLVILSAGIRSLANGYQVEGPRRRRKPANTAGHSPCESYQGVPHVSPPLRDVGHLHFVGRTLLSAAFDVDPVGADVFLTKWTRPGGWPTFTFSVKVGKARVGCHSFSLQARVSWLRVQPSPALLRHE
jgi:hypothetical protein